MGFAQDNANGTAEHEGGQGESPPTGGSMSTSDVDVRASSGFGGLVALSVPLAWSELYPRIDTLFRTYGVELAEQQGWVTLISDDRRTYDIYEEHSTLLT